MSDRVQPHDLEAERAVLGAIIVENGVYPDVAAVLAPETFFRAAHGLVFRAIQALRVAEQPVDLITLRNTLERSGDLDAVGGPAYIASLIDGVPRTTNAVHYAAIVKRLAAQRHVIDSAQALLDRAYARSDDAATLLADAVAELEAGRQRLAGSATPAATPLRRVVLTPASAVKVRPVRWLWEGMLALGTFGLLGGREGIGKTLVAVKLAADVTRGHLRGCYHGIPRDVIIVATEDSREHTIVPRLMAAGADRDRIHFIDVISADGTNADLILPIDVPELIRVITEVNAAFVIFDPLLSRLDTTLDSHKDAEVRRALEPLSRIADSANVCLMGLIHVNKTSTTDPLTMLMASRAFAAVARWVLFAMTSPEDEQQRLLGLAKSNLGRTDVPTLAYRAVPHLVAETSEGQVWTGRLEWLGAADGTIRDAIQNVTATGDKTATTEAADWLVDYLASVGGSADSSDIKKAGQKAGHSADHLRRARERLKLRTISVGFPRTTRWGLREQSGHQSGQPAPTPSTTAPTATTGDISNRLIDWEPGPVVAVGAVEQDPARGTTTAAATGQPIEEVNIDDVRI